MDDDLSRGPGDPDLRSNKWIGVDLPEVHIVIDNTHWSDLPTPVTGPEFPSWYDSDNDARSPLEADLEER